MVAVVENTLVQNVEELRRCLRGLALPSEKQLELLPPGIPPGEELALQFERSMLETRPHLTEISATQRVALEGVDRYLAQMSGSNESFWLDPAELERDPRWEEVRQLARATLAAFGWPLEDPPRDGATYITATSSIRNL